VTRKYNESIEPGEKLGCLDSVDWNGGMDWTGTVEWNGMEWNGGITEDLYY
jgi:hypothetical protein